MKRASLGRFGGFSGFAGATCLVIATVTAGSVLVAGSAAAASPTFTGPPIKVATEVPIGTPLVSLPQIFAGVKAAARAINASGGIHGHEVQVITCNNQINPNMEVSCARDAVTAGAVAMIGEFSTFNPTGVEAVLQGANVADLAVEAVVSDQFNAVNAFPLQFINGLGAPCTSPSLAKVLDQRKLRIAGVDNAFPGALLAFQALSNAANAKKGSAAEVVANLMAGITATDLSPYVSQASSHGANLVFEDLVPSQSPGFLTSSIAANKTWGYCSIDAGFTTNSLLIKLGHKFSKYYIGTPFPPLSAAKNYPELRKFIKQMRAEQAAGDSAASLDSSTYTTAGLNAWLGMQVFDQVASSMQGSIDATSFLSALRNARVNLGVIPPINFAHPMGSGQYPHVFNSESYLVHWNPTKEQTELVPGGTQVNTFAPSGLG